MRVVAVADEAGAVANAGGLDVEHHLHHRSIRGVLDRSARRPGDRLRARSAWLTTATDILVTAAVSYAINDHNHQAVAARFVVEGANASVTPDAERALTRRGVTVIPDAVANCGTNGWWWWTLFGDIAPTVDASFARIATVIPDLVVAVLTTAEQAAVTPRQAATGLAQKHMALLDAEGAA